MFIIKHFKLHAVKLITRQQKYVSLLYIFVVPINDLINIRMKYEGNISGTLQTKKGAVQVNLAIIQFKEEGSFIVYCTAVDVSGYGKTVEEAEESFKISLTEFFKYTINKGTFTSELKRMGWNISRSKRKPMIPPPMSQLLSENENFNRIFNNHEFQKFDRNVEIPIAV